MTPLVASIRYNFPLNKTISPYVFAGGGLFFCNIRLDKTGNLTESNVRRQKIKNGIGFYGGIGSVVKLNTRLSMFVEGLYLGRTADAETFYLDNSPSSIFDVNLSSISVFIGLSYDY